ncbi:MAG: FkbM family methyltransferase [Rhizobiales bacterium]|nr:FkbM family methyltransferase [Hyphomicrobiales bacterium]
MQLYFAAVIAWTVATLLRIVRRLSPQTYKRALDRITNQIAPDELFFHGLHAMGVLNYESTYQTGEQNFLERCLRNRTSAVVFDVGANKGDYARLVHGVAPSAIVHAFEPHPMNFQILEKETGPNLFAYQLALGDKPGSLTLFDYTDEDGSEHASLYSEVFTSIHKKEARGQEVECETLDRIVARLGIDQIDLLKIDTEGHELAVLRGAESLIRAGRIKVVQFEFNEMNVISRTFMRDYLGILGSYRFYRLLPEGAVDITDYRPVLHEIFAFQNIVCVHDSADFSLLSKPASKTSSAKSDSLSVPAGGS